MDANYAKKLTGCVDWVRGFNEFYLFKTSKILPLFLWNINNLKSVMKSKNFISDKHFPKIQFTIQIASVKLSFGRKITLKVNIRKQNAEIEKTNVS